MATIGMERSASRTVHASRSGAHTSRPAFNAKPIPRRPEIICHAASEGHELARRTILSSALVLLPAALSQQSAYAEETSTLNPIQPMDALKDKDYGKTRMTYSDYVQTSSGLQYKDLREGAGDPLKKGDVAVIDWDGYTIGYYGRPFEARNKPKGSSFTGDNKEYVRYNVGSNTFIPAFEEALSTMKVGGVRRIIVPVELGYPDDGWRTLGPKPSTFAGERALDFVLSNKGMIDKTLLFDIELKNVIRANE